ncbi:MAG: response regulator transcription factor [Chitinophagales bacterium]|jgi:two-component system LytT family response regulator|nr:response regulator transcription factor [Saprospirales bacterium]MBK8353004.1 response regulator transcription factor [Saprospirales bacterium]MBP6660148.1 response regulator transcription factor [Chitinophagales bacterium]
MTVCIIDDEKTNRDIISYLIQKIQLDVTILGEANAVKSGIELVNSKKPDLIFLDIEMPDGTGFDLVQKLDVHKPEIIFCTAYNQFGLRAIECSALDYILKPVTKNTIETALQKAKNIVDKNYKSVQYEILKEQLENSEKKGKRFLISNSDGAHIIATDELICCTAESNYSHLFLTKNKKIMVAKTLKEIEAILEINENFLRIHQSNIINLDKIENIIRQDNNIFVVMSNGMELAVARSKKDELLERIN